ncbi:tripartite tricarboxylate transporter TctB family protein [Acetomicrobium sp. UBA5826]|uniref:tripartite tricarboxylate transporter TctB family protein n=1 Tax=Acetomicrobium sp. UBA5826 TaxID=1946039 RepID=UPI00257B040E|nr:tripartite tricarboxylate transporter TctB family protein [Acetomicrobium sp. UBA5826]
MSKANKDFNYNYLSVLFIYLISIIFLISAFQLKDVGSRVVPIAISIFSIILATIFFLKTRMDQRRRTEEKFDFSGTKTAVKMGIVMLLYVLFTEGVGFYIATPIFLAISMIMLGQKNKKTVFLISILIPLVVWVFFDYMLNLRVPEGIFFK